MAAFIFNCPLCGKSLEAEDEWRGMETVCPGCSKKILIAGRSTAEPVTVKAVEVPPDGEAESEIPLAAAPELPPPPEPEASAHPAAAPVYAIAPERNDMALWGMILSIVGLLCCGLFTAIPGLILSGIGLSRSRELPGQTGRGMAIAGIILGTLGVLWQVVVIVICLLSGLAEVMGSNC